jgi:hypothetical protein
VEKPCQVLLDRPELKENRTAIATGMIDQRTYPRVTSGRNLDLPHGFLTEDLTLDVLDPVILAPLRRRD